MKSSTWLTVSVCAMSIFGISLVFAKFVKPEQPGQLIVAPDSNPVHEKDLDTLREDISKLRSLILSIKEDKAGAPLLDKPDSQKDEERWKKINDRINELERQFTALFEVGTGKQGDEKPDAIKDIVLKVSDKLAERQKYLKSKQDLMYAKWNEFEKGDYDKHNSSVNAIAFLLDLEDNQIKDYHNLLLRADKEKAGLDEWYDKEIAKYDLPEDRKRKLKEIDEAYQKEYGELAKDWHKNKDKVNDLSKWWQEEKAKADFTKEEQDERKKVKEMYNSELSKIKSGAEEDMAKLLSTAQRKDYDDFKANGAIYGYWNYFQIKY